MAFSNKGSFFCAQSCLRPTSAARPNTGVGAAYISDVDVTIRDNICYGFGLDAADL